jgi:phosphate transport system protein
LANHLRYIIAILNSIKDLERMADYAVSAARFFVNNQVSDNIRNLIVDILKGALLGMNKTNKSLEVKPAIDTYKTCQSAHLSFKNYYNKMLEKFSYILKKSSIQEIEKFFQGAAIVMKHIERLMDHVANISENFVFIKQADLFFNKQSKQVMKK